MTHLDEGRLQALMDGELGEAEAREAEAHLAGCAPCRAARAAAEARAAAVTAALAPFGAAPPTERVRRRVAEEAKRRGAPLPGAGGGPGGGRAAPAGPGGPARRRAERRWLGLPAEALPRAAVVTLLLAGGAAAAVLPGSPLRSLILGGDDPAALAPAAAEAPEAAAAQEEEEVGVRVTPAGGRVRILLAGLPAGAAVEVTRVGAGRAASVYAPDGARFRSGDGLLEVTSARGPVRVELPSDVAAVVSLEGRTWVESDADGLRPTAPALERGDDRLLLRVP